MATATLAIIRALRVTADRLASGSHYEWGHMGACNCGHLAQTITHLPKRQIHSWALERVGDWEQQANQYCPTSGYAIDDVITAMLDLGLSRGDIRHLERLSGPAVLSRLPAPRRYLARNRREDVVLYMRTWADLLDEEHRSAGAGETDAAAPADARAPERAA